MTTRSTVKAKSPTPTVTPPPDPAPQPLGRRVGLHLLILAAYTLLTVILTWPLAAQFTTAVPGGGDAWQHIWNLWWLKKSLADLMTNPFYSTYLYYPDGVTLLFHTLVPLESALTVPFQLLGVDLVPLYNLVMFSSFPLAGYGCWLLVRDLTSNPIAAFISGIAFAFSPYHAGHMLGHMNLASLQWIPLYLVALLKVVGAPGSRELPAGNKFGWAALAGLWLVANAYTELIYVAFLGVFTGLYLLWRVLDLRRTFLPAFRLVLPRLIVLVAVFAALAGPFIAATYLGQRGQTWMVMDPRETIIYSSDLVDSFVPSHLHPFLNGPALELAQRFPERNVTERAVFLGYTLMAVAIASLFLIRRRAIVFWVLTAGFFWLLSLGPILHILNRNEFTNFRVTVPLPYLLLYQFVPGFSVMRVPARLVVISGLALAVLVGYFLAWLFKRAQEKLAQQQAPGNRLAPAPLIATALIGLLIILEFLAIPYPMAPPGYRIPFYSQLAAEPGDFAVLELPLRPMSDFMAYQTVHGKRLVYGYLSRQPPDPFVQNTPALSYLLNTTPLDDPVGEAAAQSGLASLRQANVRYAIIHWWAFTEQEAALMRTKLARIFPNVPTQEFPNDRMEVFELAP